MSAKASVRAVSFGLAAGVAALLSIVLAGVRIGIPKPELIFADPEPVTLERLKPPEPPEPKPLEHVKAAPIKVPETQRVAPSPVPLPDIVPQEIAPGEGIAPMDALGSGAASGGGVSEQGPPLITRPRWLNKPSGATVARFYPERALDRGRSGKVVLDCLVGLDGRLACAVASEEPERWGFGAAALRIAKEFRMAPQLEDGQPTAGGRVSVPIVFNPG